MTENNKIDIEKAKVVVEKVEAVAEAIQDNVRDLAGEEGVKKLTFIAKLAAMFKKIFTIFSKN